MLAALCISRGRSERFSLEPDQHPALRATAATSSTRNPIPTYRTDASPHAPLRSVPIRLYTTRFSDERRPGKCHLENTISEKTDPLIATRSSTYDASNPRRWHPGPTAARMCLWVFAVDVWAWRGGDLEACLAWALQCYAKRSGEGARGEPSTDGNSIIITCNLRTREN
jgi:hypothetical protein